MLAARQDRLGRYRTALMRSRRAAVIPVALTAVFLLLGVLAGWVWHRLAPVELSLVLRDGSTVPLPTESNHVFDGVALFALMGLAAGLVTGAALWQWRSHRGAVVLLAGVLGSLLSAWVAYRGGLWLSDAPSMPGAAGSVVALPPVLSSPVVVVAQPLGAALAYGTAVSFSGDDDLGRAGSRPPPQQPAPAAEVSSDTAGA